MTLFRDEVVKAAGAHTLGTIRIGRNPSFVVVAVLATGFAAALITYAALGEMTRRAKLNGLLVPVQGTVNVSSPQAGFLLDVRVKEGDEAESDQVLMVIGVDRSTSKGDAAVLIAESMEQRRMTLESELALARLQYRQRQQATSDRARSLDIEIRQSETELDSVRRRLLLAHKSVERYAQLAKDGFVADIQAQQKQEDLLDLLARESSAERARTSLQRDAQALRAEQEANGSALTAQLIQLDRNLAALRQEGTENSARRQLVVNATEAGTVGAVLVHRGQLVQQGQTLAVIIPRQASGLPSPLEAQLFAPSRTAGFVQAGQTVWLRYSAYPYQKFGMAKGSVKGVSRTPLGAQDLPGGQGQALMNAAQTTEAMYRVTVALESQAVKTYGQLQSLKPGMTLEADVVQDRRHVYEWLLEPILASSGFGSTFASKAE